MDKPRELYYEELSNLHQFREKIDTHAIYKKDLESFSEQYEELVAQAKVITRVSDRLQKKLDNANVQIRAQNVEIQDKNTQLEDTIQQLAKARVGRRASTIMLTVALLLFVLEQFILQPIIDEFVGRYLPQQFIFLGSLIVLLILFFGVKFLEGRLEDYFMTQEKKKILSQEKQKEAEEKAAF